MRSRQRTRLPGLVVALVATALAALCAHVFRDTFQTAPTLPFLAAVVVAAWYGGSTPGFVATTLGTLVLVLDAGNSFPLGEPGNLLRLILFAAISALCSGLIGQLRTARQTTFSSVQATQIAERRRAEEGHRFLAEASAILASSLDYETTLASLTRLVVPRLADWCSVYIVEEDGEARQLAVAHVDPAKVAWAGELARRYPPDRNAPRGIPQVLRTGQAELIPEISAAMLQEGARNAEHLEILRGLGLTSLMIVPLKARGRTLGAITFVTAESGQRYGPSDLVFAEDLALRAAYAVDNARLYREAQNAVRQREETLQRHLHIERQLTLLVEASGRLTGSLEPAAVLSAILDVSHHLMAADAYAIWRQHPDTGLWEIASAAGLSVEYLQQASKILAPGQRMLDEPVIAEDVMAVASLEARREVYRAEGIVSLLALPLRIQGDISGTLVLYFRSRQPIDESMLRPATALANLAASVLGTAELYARESGLRRQAEDTQARLEFLARASVLLASSLDYQETLDALTRLAVPRLADWCAVHVVGEDHAVRQLAVAHVDPLKVEWARELERRYPADPASPSGLYEALRTGLPELVPLITEEMILAGARDAEHLEIIRGLGLTSYMVVPLRARERTLGAITFVSAESGQQYGPADLALAEDLARRAALAIDNARLYRETQEADRAKDQFLAMLGHELRNPLAPVRNACHVLRLAGELGPVVEQARDIIDRQVTHMTRLIDDLLDVSRIKRGKILLRLQRLDLAELVRTTAEDHRHGVEAAGLSLAVDVVCGPIWVEGDPTRLAQALDNLLHNAVKFTDRGGHVALRLIVDDQRQQAAVSVRDTGVGIEADMLPRLFDIFAQADRSLDRSRGGLGLGLALVKGLIELHGGAVSASSAGAGRGAEFTFRVPLEEEAPAGDPVEQRPADALRHGAGG